MLTYLKSRENETPVVVNKNLISNAFDFGKMGQHTQAVNVFKKKVTYYDAPELAQIQKSQPGSMFKENSDGVYGSNTNVAPGLKTLNDAVKTLPKGFVPDFTKLPVSTDVMDHTLLGACTLYRYEATLHGRKVYWDMAVRNSDGLGWVERIKFADAEMNRFGGHDEIIDSGFLTSKPLEYRKQMGLVLHDPQHDFNRDVKPSNDPDYVDVRGIIGRLDFMKNFYASPVIKKAAVSPNIQPVPNKPRVIVNLPAEQPRVEVQQPAEPLPQKQARASIPVPADKLEEWDLQDFPPRDSGAQRELQDYKNKKYSGLVEAVLGTEMESVDAERRRYETDGFKKDLKDVVALAKKKVDADTWRFLERTLKIHGYESNGEPSKANRLNFERYKGDTRQLTGFLMIDGVEHSLLPAKDNGKIFIGKKVEGQAASDYLALPDNGKLSEFQALVSFEKGKYYITPISSNPVEMTLGKTTKTLELGKKYPLVEGARYKIGSSELEFYPKKSLEEIYDIDHVELTPAQRGQYFSKTILAKEAISADFNPQQTLERHLDKMNQRSREFILPDDTHAVTTLLKFIQREEEGLRLPKGSHAIANRTVYDAGFVYDELNHIKRDPGYLKRRVAVPAIKQDQVVAQPVATPVAKPVRPVAPEPKIPHTHTNTTEQLSGLVPNEANQARNIERDLAAVPEIHGPISWETNEGVGYKSRNEDAVVWGYSKDANGKYQFYVVVLDGMGGHGKGDVAAEIGGNEIHQLMNHNGDLPQAFQGAAKSISNQLGANPDSPGAVAAGFQIIERDGKRFARIVHVGDAAIKVLRQDKNGDWQVVHATEDENAALIDKKLGNIKDTLEMRVHPNANVVLNTLGLGRNGKGPVAEIELQKGDRIIGMSDGLGDNASTADIIRANAAHTDVSCTRRELVELAKKKMTYFAEGKATMKALKELIKTQSATVPNGIGVKKRAVGLEPYGYDGYYVNKAGELIAPDHKTVTEPWVALTEPAGHWMNSKGHVFNEEGVLVDKFKPDNVSVFVYEEK
ncbi:MAG: hypothetical protein ACD_73C00048G0001 [uncultured bacterium]|nr:MAG: hypothetical protein ACD_73C00048G0001 [uncultured bacterium]